MDTARWYRDFATRQAQGHSPAYRELAEQIAGDRRLLALLDELPEPKRQPNLLLAAVRYEGGPPAYPAFGAWTLAHWPRVRATILRRRTQTNECGRCATLLPLLARLPQPLALIEAGASAGLCLYPDRYRYRYDERLELGPDAGQDTAAEPGREDRSPAVTCRTTGPVPFPERLPEIVWRAGVDLDPLDVRDPADARWLECLVWPGQDERLRRLRHAAEVARAEPTHLVRGDLNERIRELVAQVPSGATPVVFHSAVLAYLPAGERDAFATTMRELPGHWISNESPGTLPSVAARLPRPAPEGRTVFVLALDGRPVAFTGPHGEFLDWFGA